MQKFIDYYKVVGVMDEGIMALNSLKNKTPFPTHLKEDLINIVNFLMLAQKPEYENLLFDKYIAIDKEKLDLIHKQLNKLEFSEETVNSSIKLLEKTGNDVSQEEIQNLEKNLLKLSNPIWVTIFMKS